MPTKNVDARLFRAIPVELSGKWVAWSADHSSIVASAETLPELWDSVKERKINDPVFEKIPRADVRFVGMR